MKLAVLFIAHSYPSGLVYHLTYLADALNKASKGGVYDFFVGSEGREQYGGTWSMLNSCMDSRQVIKFLDYNDDIVLQAQKLLECHDKLLIHFGGGWHQLKPMTRLKKIYKDCLVLVATTHSYQHGSWKSIPTSTIQFLLYNRYVDHVIFQSPFTARDFVGGKRLLQHNKASIIPLGVEKFSEIELSTIPPSPLGEPDIRVLLKDQHYFNFCYIAKFKKVKKHLWLVDKLAGFLKNNPKIRIFFLGSGEFFESVREKIMWYDLSNQIICPGSIPRACMPWVVAQFNAALVVSRNETFGHCFLEPGFAAIPVIGTRVGAGEYLIQDMITGIGFEPGDIEKLKQAMLYFANHPDEAKAMGRNYHQFVVDHFSHATIAQAHHRLYGWLLENKMKNI